MTCEDISEILKNLAPDTSVEIVSPLLFNIGSDDQGTLLYGQFGHDEIQKTKAYFEKVEILSCNNILKNYARFYEIIDTKEEMYQSFLIAVPDISDIKINQL